MPLLEGAATPATSFPVDALRLPTLCKVNGFGTVMAEVSLSASMFTAIGGDIVEGRVDKA